MSRPLCAAAFGSPVACRQAPKSIDQHSTTASAPLPRYLPARAGKQDTEPAKSQAEPSVLSLPGRNEYLTPESPPDQRPGNCLTKCGIILVPGGVVVKKIYAAIFWPREQVKQELNRLAFQHEKRLLAAKKGDRAPGKELLGLKKARRSEHNPSLVAQLLRGSVFHAQGCVQEIMPAIFLPARPCQGLFTLLRWMALRAKVPSDAAESEGFGGSKVEGENRV